jgi:hypothetical protein
MKTQGGKIKATIPNVQARKRLAKLLQKEHVESVLRLGETIELVDSDECEWVKEDITWKCRQRKGKRCLKGRCYSYSITATKPDGTKVTKIFCECV